MSQKRYSIKSILHPNSIAVIGASPNIYKWGSFLLASMIKGGFKGDILPINPKQESIFGKTCYKSIHDIKSPVDMAFITLPVHLAEKAVDDCIQKDVKGIVLITSGFSEAGEEGSAIEKRIREKVRASKTRMIGPNTMGLINTHHDMFITASFVRPPRGAISMISQSGNLGSQVMQWAENMGIGISKFIGIGNEADIDLTDMIEYFHADPTTKIILAYLEGIKDGRRFLEVASKVSMDKPIIALKGGRTDAGSKAAKSHTGSLAGQYPVTLGALQQAGVIVADNPMELIDFSVAFQHLPLPKGNRVGIFTLGGGWGVLGSDECNERGFVLPDLPQNIIDEIDKILPSYWSRGNPIDMVGDLNPEVFKTAVRLLAGSDQFDAIVALGGLGASHFIIRVVSTARDIDPAFDDNMVQMAINEVAKLEARHLRDIGNAIHDFKKPILSVSHEEKLNYTIPIDDKMVIAYPTPEKAVRVLDEMLRYSKWKSKRQAD